MRQKTLMKTHRLAASTEPAIRAYQAGRYGEAIERFRQLIQLNPDRAELYTNLGIALRAAGLLSEAIESYGKAVRLDPRSAETYYNLANALKEQERYSEAIDNYKRATEVNPDFAQAYYNLGNLLRGQQQYADAAENYRQAIILRPNHAAAHNNLGMTLKHLGRNAEAIEAYRRAVGLRPDYAEAYNNLGIALKDEGRLDEALGSYSRGIELKPDYAEAYCNRGTALHSCGRYAEAIEHYEEAIRLDPDYAGAHWNRSLLLLLTGRFAEGWEEYEWRRKIGSAKTTYPHTHDRPRWNGSPFAGKRLLVHYEQGLGDNLQFVRYLPMVKELGGTVIFETLGPMRGLLRKFPGIDKLVEMSPGRKPDVEFDLHASLLDLPGVFGTTLETIPSNVPYLYAESAKAEYWRGRIAADEFRVGLVWGGRPIGPNEVLTLKHRSCELEHFTPLADIEGVRLYGLQKGPAAAQMNDLPRPIVEDNFGEQFEDLADTAGAIENLDLVISIDTSVAHLAGAMGKPTWVLLKSDADWRWLLDRDDSPWYPTMRLFRQEKGDDWAVVVKRIAEELRALVCRRAAV